MGNANTDRHTAFGAAIALPRGIPPVGSLVVHVRAVSVLLMLAAAAVYGEQGDTLYRWVDSDGIPHFGDTPPPGQAEQAERLDMPTFAAPDRPPDQQPYSILNQLERMETQRERLARERREKLQQEREYRLRKRELEARREAAAPAPPTGTSVLVYPRPGHWRPPFHTPGGRPDHARPPGDLWPPEHPAYRAYPRPPVPRPNPPSRILPP